MDLVELVSRYDGIGNPLNDGVYSYTWEMGRQLAGMSGNGQNITYKYNDSGIRTEKTANGVTTKYILDGSNVIYETDGTNKIYYTYDSAGKSLSMNLNGTEYRVHSLTIKLCMYHNALMIAFWNMHNLSFSL